MLRKRGCFAFLIMLFIFKMLQVSTLIAQPNLPGPLKSIVSEEPETVKPASVKQSESGFTLIEEKVQQESELSSSTPNRNLIDDRVSTQSGGLKRPSVEAQNSPEIQHVDASIPSHGVYKVYFSNDEVESEIAADRHELEEVEQRLKKIKNNIAEIKPRLAKHKEAGDTERFNKLVRVHNAYIMEYDQNYEHYTNKITSLNNKVKRSALAPLKVVTKGSGYYFFKICASDSGQPVMTLFLHPQANYLTHIPLGNYIIKYAIGKNWVNEQTLFGVETKLYQLDDIFTFSLENDRIVGREIELYPHVDGNLTKKLITNEKW